jgi:succinyl-diaminopimelate desuccinylase
LAAEALPTASLNDGLTRSICELASALIQIPSRGGLDPPSPVFQRIAGWMREARLKHRVITGSHGEPVALVCDVSAGSTGTRYILNAPVDTAPFGDRSAWKHSPTSGLVHGDWLYGRGSADCKTAIAIFCHLAREYASTTEGQPPAYGFSVLFDAGEHSGRFTGVRKYFADENARRAVAGVMIGYPGDNRIVVGGRGFLRATIRVSGVTAHSGGSSLQGVNAVHRAAELVLTLDSLRLPSDSDFPLEPRLTVTAAHGGQGYAIVPDKCMLKVDIRLTPTFDTAEARRLLDTVVHAMDAKWGDWEVRPTDIRYEEGWPAYQLNEDAPVVRALSEAVEDVFGFRLPLKTAGPSNTGNFLSSLGIAATSGFGVRYEGLHSVDEAVVVSSILPVFKVYERAISLLTKRRINDPPPQVV